jgi:hypothetical protein
VSATFTSLDEYVRPWRRAAVVAGCVAALELLLLAGGAVYLLRGGDGDAAPTERQAAAVAKPPADAKRAAAQAPARRAEPAATAQLARGETSVLVLNGNGRSGAAAAEATRIQRRGYLVSGTGNAPRTDFARTTVMYRPGYRGEGVRLARDLGVRTAGPLDGLRPRDLLGAHVAVIVGRS